MKKHTLVLAIYLILSEFLQAYLIASASKGVYLEDVISCGFAGCQLTFLYAMPFELLDIAAYAIYGSFVMSLNLRQLLIWLVPFWIFWIVIFSALNTISNILGLRFMFDLTINIHRSQVLVPNLVLEMLFSIAGFLGAFFLLNRINKRLIKR